MIDTIWSGFSQSHRQRRSLRRHDDHASTRQQRDRAVIEISDDGPGIPQDERTRSRTIRATGREPGTRASGGTGLGLSIVAQIVAAHGGTVNIAPTGVGTKVVVELPSAHSSTQRQGSVAGPGWCADLVQSRRQAIEDIADCHLDENSALMQ